MTFAFSEIYYNGITKVSKQIVHSQAESLIPNCSLTGYTRWIRIKMIPWLYFGTNQRWHCLYICFSHFWKSHFRLINILCMLLNHLISNPAFRKPLMNSNYNRLYKDITIVPWFCFKFNMVRPFNIISLFLAR